MKKLIVGNWKMNGRLEANGRLFAALRQGHRAADCDVAVCVPSPYLAQAANVLGGSSIAWGAQNLSEHRDGPFTGEVSASMLTDFSCRYVIVGHSERRTLYGENSAVVAKKCAAAMEANLTPIVCVGETLAQRESGAAEAVIAEQLAPLWPLMDKVTPEWVVAYEPVWAIGSGKAATPQQIGEIHRHIRRLWEARTGSSAVRILYGGSVSARNSAQFFAVEEVGGALVGGASLLAEDFLAICRATVEG